MTSDLGPWDPIDLAIAIELFSDAPFRWWVTGGHALELHLDRTWRTHSDTDISFCRNDASEVRDILDGWDIHVAADGQLSPWDGEPPDRARHQNNLWCRQDPSGPWVLDLTVSDGDDTQWIFRRDPSFRVNWNRAVLLSSSRVPYLAPELQLLFKSKNQRAKDDADLDEVVNELTDDRLAVLAARLPPDHPWQAHVAAR